MALTNAEKIAKIKIPLGISDTSQDDLLGYLLDQVEDVAKSLVYFSEEYDELPFPTKYDWWSVRATVEMYNHKGQEGVRSYSENGLSITYEDMKSGLSNGLLNQLTPRVGIPR